MNAILLLNSIASMMLDSHFSDEPIIITK